MHISRLPSGVHMQVEADRAAAFINRETGGVQLCGSQRKNTNKIQHNIYNSAGSPPPRTDAQQHVVQLLHSYSAHTCAVTKEQTLQRLRGAEADESLVSLSSEKLGFS